MKILFLTNNVISTPVINGLIEKGHDVLVTGNSVSAEDILKEKFHLAVSYCYRTIISKEVIDLMEGNIVNLHISFLPWNRGASPNYWSFRDNTPKGVTLHYVDEKLDRGRIITQELVDLSNVKTYAESYQKLHISIQRLFFKAFEQYDQWEIIAYKPSHIGSYHSQQQLWDTIGKNFDWNSPINTQNS